MPLVLVSSHASGFALTLSVALSQTISLRMPRTALTHTQRAVRSFKTETFIMGTIGSISLANYFIGSVFDSSLRKVIGSHHLTDAYSKDLRDDMNVRFETVYSRFDHINSRLDALNR